MSHEEEAKTPAADMIELSDHETTEISGAWRWQTTVCGRWQPETVVEAFLDGFYKSQGLGGWQCPN